MSIPELDEALHRRSLTLFIGADLPSEITGLPSRRDLARTLARRKGLVESLSLAEVAQRVAQGGNRWEFTAFIRDQLDTTGKTPQPFHERIVERVQEHRIETLVTTAYDNLLELAFQEASVPINRVVSGSDVSFINPDRPTLVKLYGDFQQPDTLVVTADDHYGLWRDRDKEDLLDEVRVVLRKETVLFLGYNLADPDFNLLWREVLDRAGRFARTAYAVWPGLPEDEVRMWRDRGIAILDNDPFEILGDLVSTDTVGLKPLSKSRDVPAKQTLYLDTTATLFAQWLADYTRMIPYRDFPTEKGRLVLQRVKPPPSIQSPTILEMDTIYLVPKEDEDAEAAWPFGAAITFRVIPLSSERVEVQAKCNQMVVADYFHKLLAEIKQRWPTQETASEASFVPSRRPEPIGAQSGSQSLGGEKDMDYERGLDVLKQQAEGTDWYQDFTVHEAPLRENLRDERRYGPSEQTRRDRTRIVDRLNALALEHLGISFNDLCMGKQPPPRPSTEAKGDDASLGPNQVYGIGTPWAVLVGVNEYEDKANYGQLQVCVKDVEAIHEQLVAGGFNSARIRLLTDHTDEPPTRANVLTALKAVADATEPDDLLLFYYSGHGAEDGGESYLVARDGRRLVLSDTAVSLSRIKEIVEEAPARAKVIVLDACHSGADIGGKGPEPMSAAFIRRVFEQAEGMAILASCKQGQLSYEWRDNERSVFTHFLLEALTGAADRDEKGFVTVQDASRHVTNGVKLWASQRNISQKPTLQYTVAGDIVLVHYQ